MYYTYNGCNQLESIEEYATDGVDVFLGTLNKTTTFTYDANGNMLTKRIVGQDDEDVVECSYTYNPLNQLTEFEDAEGNVTTYAYDGTGMRVSKTKGTDVQKFYWDRGYVINESLNGAFTASNSVGSEGIFERTTESEENTQTNILFKNAHGDVTDVVSNDEVTNEYDYDAYGNQKNTSTNDTNPFRYCGEYYDEESGLIYLRNRYYDPEIERFITEDPIQDGMNWYAYCGNNPVMYIDSTGLAPRPYQPELWNRNPDNLNSILYRTNCYAYALDFCGEVTYGEKSGTVLPIGDFALQPGDLRTNKPTLLHNIWYSAMDINMPRYSLAGAMLDARGNGHTFRIATSDNIAGNNLGENEWTVYLVATSDGEDYHWYRQNADENGNFDGTWSHKPGRTPVTNREFLGVGHYADGTSSYLYGDVITDPTAISRQSFVYHFDEGGNVINKSEIINYDIVVGAYVVGY